MSYMAESRKNWAREITVGVVCNLIASGLIFSGSKLLHLMPTTPDDQLAIFAIGSVAVAMVVFFVGRAIVNRRYRSGFGLMGLGVFLFGAVVQAWQEPLADTPPV